MNFDTERCNVFLLKLSGQMAFDEGGLSVIPCQLVFS